MQNPDFGFQEIEHTADLAIHVWALDLSCLFKLSVEGMYSLLEINMDNEGKIKKIIELDAHDNETLLVNFLNEILFHGQKDSLGFNSIELIIGAGKLKAICSGSKIIKQTKEIKAVTFHNLEITNLDGKFSVDLVFDV